MGWSIRAPVRHRFDSRCSTPLTFQACLRCRQSDFLDKRRVPERNSQTFPVAKDPVEGAAGGSVTPQLGHSATRSLRNSVTPQLGHSIAGSLHSWVTPYLGHSIPGPGRRRRRCQSPRREASRCADVLHRADAASTFRSVSIAREFWKRIETLHAVTHLSPQIDRRCEDRRASWVLDGFLRISCCPHSARSAQALSRQPSLTLRGTWFAGRYQMPGTLRVPARWSLSDPAVRHART
jgi:hypothetical protein